MVDFPERGPEATFLALYPRLVRFARAVAPTGIDPEDLVQEALTRCLSRHRDFRGVSDVGSYLARSIVNLSVNALKRRALQRRYENSRAAVAVAPPAHCSSATSMAQTRGN